MTLGGGLRAFLAGAMLIAAIGAADAQSVVVTDARFDALVAQTKASMLADPKKAVVEAQDARAYADAAPDPAQRKLMQATAAWLLGEAFTRIEETERAAPLIEMAVVQARTVAPGSRLLADALLSRGSIHAAAGDVAGAMSDFHAAHDLFRKLNDPRSRARAITSIANLYFDANDLQNALKYFGQALDIYRADPGLAVAIYNGRGVTLIDMSRPDEAITEFSSALKLAREMASPLLTATVLNNAARAWLAKGDVGAADRTIAQSMATTRGIGSTAFRASQIALMAQSALQRRDYPRAAALSEQVFAGVDLIKTTLADREAHKTAYDAYRALGRSNEALAHLTAWKRLDDEATKLARSNGAALMAARFDFANQELRIANLKADDLQKSVVYERSRARTQRVILFGGAGAAFVIVTMLLFGLITLRRSRDQVREANTDLEATNSALGKALAAKTEFLATTSHEIRTPLNGILGMTQVILADARIDPATRDRVNVVHGAGVTMRALVDDILDVAKMETGNLAIEAVPFDLERALSDSTRMWRDQAIAKGLSFEVNLDACPGRIVGDPSRLRQIVFNLLSNALKFTPKGDVRFLATATDDGWLDIVVSDTGIGIAPDKHEEIFEAFRQADAGTTRQFGGTGLGLSICRSLSRAMGGDVTVENGIGEGAIFTLRIPLIVAVTEETIDAADGSPGGLLIVDRNPITRAMLKTMFEGHGESVEVATDVEQASRAIVARPVLRILIDEKSLGEDGDPVKTLSTFSKNAPGATISILCIANEQGRHEAYRAAGAARVIVRPIAREALIVAICDEPISADAPKNVTQAA